MTDQEIRAKALEVGERRLAQLENLQMQGRRVEPDATVLHLICAVFETYILTGTWPAQEGKD